MGNQYDCVTESFHRLRDWREPFSIGGETFVLTSITYGGPYDTVAGVDGRGFLMHAYPRIEIQAVSVEVVRPFGALLDEIENVEPQPRHTPLMRWANIPRGQPWHLEVS